MTTRFDQTFGVEIELILPRGKSREDLAAHLVAAGVSAVSEHYNHTTRNHWKIVTDASLGYGAGAEVVSPVLTGSAGAVEVKKVCDALVAFGAQINRQCGLHVHVGFRDATADQLKALVKAYTHFEGTLDTIMPVSRRGRNNSMCQPAADYAARVARAGSTVDEVIRATTGRYFKLNLQSFWSHGTVEFRHHSGTVEASKVLNWLDICLGFAWKARNAGTATGPTPLDHYRGVPINREIWTDTYAMVDAMKRDCGATLEELCQISGMKRPQPAHRCRLLGYDCRVTIENGRKVFRAVFEGGPAELPTDATLHSLCEWTEVGQAARDWVAARFSTLN